MAGLEKTQIGHVNEGIDYVLNGVVHAGAVPSAVMVTAESDLANLPDTYEPGTIAYTAGYQDIWQLAADGTWADFFAASENGGGGE